VGGYGPRVGFTTSLTDFGNPGSSLYQIVSFESSLTIAHSSQLDFISDTATQLSNRASNAPLLRYVDSIRTHGHRAARVDPLDIIQREEVAALDPTRYGLVDDSKKYNINGIIWNNAFGSHTDSVEVGERWWTLGEITSHLRSVYVGRIAFEYMHSPSKTERLWFSHYLEALPPVVSTEEEIQKKKRIHELLVRSETFDAFLQSKFPNLKRYGLEGGESMLVALDALFSVSSQGP
jgi:probable 2-oxoglutarate dehydrogenase E1 component DHKTD1